MAKFATLFLVLGTMLAMASFERAPAETRPQQQDYGAPTPLHALTGIAFHASAAGF